MKRKTTKRPARKAAPDPLLGHWAPDTLVGDPWDLPYAQTQSEHELRIGLSAARALVSQWGYTVCGLLGCDDTACRAIAILRQQVEEHDGRKR